MKNTIASILNLSEQERVQTPQWLDRAETVQDWASRAFSSLKDQIADSDLTKTLPWIGTASKLVPPAHFLFEGIKLLTKVQEPESLAFLSCTVAYQTAAAMAVRDVGSPKNSKIVGRLHDSIGMSKHDFSYFTLESALSHRFIRNADMVVSYYAKEAGYSTSDAENIIKKIHDIFLDQLRLIIAAGKDIEKFAPLINWLSLDSSGALARAALRRHVQYTKWSFENAPVLGYEPYALSHIYVDTGCRVTTQREIQERRTAGRPLVDQFVGGSHSSQKSSMVGYVMNLIRNGEFNEPIVIQGSAGAGKSSFTKCLASALADEGLRPIRIRLRDVALQEQDFYTALGKAVMLEDEAFLQTNERFPSVEDILMGGAVFDEEIFHYNCKLCPHVLILDGWDEVSLDVNEGFKQRVKELLRNIRSEFFRGSLKVRVILTGRPSDAIDDAKDFLRPDTPFLTISPLQPAELVLFSNKIRDAIEARPISVSQAPKWRMPSDAVLRPLLESYNSSFAAKPGESRASAILGFPFLAHLAFRVAAEQSTEPEQVTTDQTSLLRRLTDIVTRDAHHSTDQIDIVWRGGTSAREHMSHRVAGEPLRRLLHQTAEKMTISGRESLSRAAIAEYLNVADVEERLVSVGTENVLTAMMISFYFKGGNTELGCEFTHKSLREYLFAEAVVERLKRFSLENHYSDSVFSERPRYWDNFSMNDPRYTLSWDLANLLSPQWLMPEPMAYLDDLIRWEIQRSHAEFPGSGVGVISSRGSTRPISLSGWRFLRNMLADIWDWWAEGVHLRPQVELSERTRLKNWVSPMAQLVIERNMPLGEVGGVGGQVPPRLTALDAHLGDALFRLSSIIHSYVSKKCVENSIVDELLTRSRSQYQSANDNIVRFRPGGARPEYFQYYCARINAAGYSPMGLFPSKVIADGIDLSGASCELVCFRHARLIGAKFRGTSLCGADFGFATLSRSDMTRANLTNATLVGTTMVDGTFDSANLSNANLSNSDARRSTFRNAILHNAVLSCCDMVDAKLCDAVADGAHITFAQLMKADLRGASLSETILLGSDLTGARMDEGARVWLDKVQSKQVTSKS